MDEVSKMQALAAPTSDEIQKVDVAQSVVQTGDNSEVTLTISKIELPEKKSGQAPVPTD